MPVEIKKSSNTFIYTGGISTQAQTIYNSDYSTT